MSIRGSGDVYVYDMAMSYEAGPASKYNGIATIWVKDELGADVSGVTVYGDWSGAAGDSDSGQTGGDGKVTVESDQKKGGGTFTFTVTDITGTGYVYNPALDLDNPDSITAP